MIDKITDIFFYSKNTRKITNLLQLPEWISSKCVGLARIGDDLALLLKDGSYLRCEIDDCIIGNKTQLAHIPSSEICSILNFSNPQHTIRDYNAQKLSMTQPRS